MRAGEIVTSGGINWGPLATDDSSTTEPAKDDSPSGEVKAGLTREPLTVPLPGEASDG